jgi:hypothetical protein
MTEPPEHPDPEALAAMFRRELWDALSDMPSMRNALARGRTTEEVNVPPQEWSAALGQIIWVLVANLDRTAQEVDRLRGIAGLDREPPS